MASSTGAARTGAAGSKAAAPRAASTSRRVVSAKPSLPMIFLFYVPIDTGVKSRLRGRESRATERKCRPRRQIREGAGMRMSGRSIVRMGLLASAAALLATGVAARAQAPSLLFHVSADKGFVAERAGGDPVPNFQDKVSIVPDGAIGGAMRWEDDGVLAWNAPGNIYAQRGTLAFFWRSRTPVGVAPFVIFRVGYADHTSWDMAFLRIDWNGHGFDALVTDNGLPPTRVSFKLDKPPTADAWSHLAFTWDETKGVQLFVDGKSVAKKETKAI